MIELRYGPVVTEVRCEPLDYQYLRKIMTFDPEQPSLFSEHHFLSGLLPHVVERLVQDGVEHEVIGAPEVSEGAPSDYSIPEDFLPGITLRDYQCMMVRKALWYRRGIIESPTGSGKTEISAAIAKWLQWKKGLGTLVLVPGITSMHQTIARFKKRGVSDVGGIGGGFFEPGQCMVAVINSIYKALANNNEKLLAALDDIGCVIFMETHHLPARTWTYVGERLNVPYRFGLSATPFEDGEEPTTTGDFRLIGVTGPIIARLPDSTLMNLGHLTSPKVHMLRISGPFSRSTNWPAIKKNYLTDNESRNADITKLCTILSENRRVLMLVSEIGHGKKLAKAITEKISDSVYMFSGGSTLSVYRNGRSKDQTKVPVNELVNRLDDQPNYLLIGSPALDEDFDLPSIDVLIVAAFGKAFRRVVQRAGRILRVHTLPDGSRAEAHIIDFDDRSNVVLKRHSEIRRSTYLSRYGGADGFGIFDYRNADDILRVLSVTNPA